ncbi:MAG: Rrf2 family transcriptional regulator [Deltaproteobacteria bacterium]|nr:Rrf2 family transcriptional regulator [Deltaproteobacteria bacterium]MBI3756284.1 Rrf2 family transcriptional regulator [Deltaproteobacteria bacterium]
MFRLSKAAEYAIRGVLHLSFKAEGETCGIDEIAKAQGVPPAYLAKLFQSLARKGFVRSFRGVEGGFILTKRPKDITLLEIIEAMEGRICLNDCLIYAGYCPKDDVCPVHPVWKEAHKRFVDYLKGCTFEEMANASKVKAMRTKEKISA